MLVSAAGTPARPWRPSGLRSKGWATSGRALSFCGQWVYDAYKADRVIRWIEDHCLHAVGPLQGQPVRMMRHHRRMVRKIFGWLHASGDAAGLRRFRTVFHAVPRGNAKTTFLAWIGLYMLLGDGEAGAHCYSIGSDESEARLMFEEAVRIVQLSPRLAPHLEVVQPAIYHGETMSSFRPLARKKKGHHGLNPHFVGGDELHTWTSREQYDAVRSARAKRRQPLQAFITTAGNDRTSLCWELWETALRVKSGQLYLPDWLVVIYQANPEDDWTDEATWRRANPALSDGVKSLTSMRDEFGEAQQSASGEAAFRQLHLNQWTERHLRWLSAADYDACTVELSKSEVLDRLNGVSCYGGLDLAKVRDLSSLLRIFPAPNPIDEHRAVLIWDHWIDHGSVVERMKRDQVPYGEWVAQGWIRQTPGKSTDMDQIKDDLVEMHASTPFVSLGYDPTFADALIQHLLRDGVPCERVLQTLSSLALPSATLERMLIEKDVIVLADPVARWAVGNVAVFRAGDGKFKPDKAVSTERIDPISAAVTAIRRYQDLGDIVKKNVYETRGALVL